MARAPAAAGAPETPEEFGDLLLSVVADLTGYPVSMLNIDMELEADLGVDSIKRVEIFSTVRERVGALPPDLDLMALARLRTIREIIEFITARHGETEPAAPELTPTPQDTPTPAPQDTPTPAPQDTPTPAPQDADTVSTRFAIQMSDAPAPGLPMPGLGNAPLVVTEDGGGVAALVAARLTGRGIPATAAAGVPADAQAVVDLSGLAEIASPDDALERQKSAFDTARSVASRFAERGGLLVTVQDTGGDFGLAGRCPDRAWLGGIAALTRVAAREWPAATVKAIDCERAGRDPEAIAAVIVDELLNGGPVTEVGLRADGTRAIPHLVERPVQTEGPASIRRESVIVVTGGARGVTASALAELARRHRPRIVLLGRTELLAEPAGLADVTGEAALVRALAARAADTSPAALTAQARRILAAREVDSTLAALKDAGAEVRYEVADVRDGGAVAAVLDRVRADWGPVTAIVHAAGALADRLLADKTDGQYERVLDTKVAGLRALLAATAEDPLEAIVLFSSIAAVTGNAGQSDYAMANETLNHVASAERARRPGCLVRSIAWGPWRGGMVTPALAEQFARRGIPLLPPASGAAAFADEWSDPGADTRVAVVAGDLSRLAATVEPATVQIRVRDDTHPYLADHDIAGAPLLPLAMALNWFTAAAVARWPAAARVVLRDVRVYRELTFPRLAGRGHELTVHTRHAKSGAPDELETELRDEDGTPCIRAELPGEEGEPDAAWDTPCRLAGYDDEIYDGHVLFHGPRFRAVRSVRGVGAAGADATVTGLAGLGWGGDHWQLDAAAVDGGLQVAELWACRMLGYATIPMAIAECRAVPRRTVADAARCVVRAVKVHDAGARCDVALLGDDGVPVVELLGVQLVRRPD